MNSVINIAVLSVALICSPFAIAGETLNLKIYETQGEYEDVRQDLVDAIIGQGYVIDYNGHPSEMLKRTRKDVGGKPLYSEAEYLVFCSAVLSRKAMESDIRNVGYCPYILTVYETNRNPGTIYVSYRKLTSTSNMDSSLLAVENMLDEIAREAVE
jgi:uncharacterized protein (DUF302 family)